MSEISEEATRLIDNFEYAVQDAVSDYMMAGGASYKNQARYNLEDYIAELELENGRLRGEISVEKGKLIGENIVMKSILDEMKARIAELEGKNERFTVHSDIERQDDKWIPEVQE